MTSSNLRRVLIVVPALNEQASVGRVVTDIRRELPIATVLVVDDGSTDATARVAQQAGARVCQLPLNLGVGGAMRTGFKYASMHGFDVVVQVDADGQHDARELPRLVAGLDVSDVVIGSRFAGGGRYPARGPRRWAMFLLAAVISRLAKQRLTDVTSGYRAANRKAITVFTQHYPAEYLGDTVESLVIALRSGCTVSEVPVSMRVRTTGSASQSTLRASLYLFRAVTALFLALVRKWPVTSATTDEEV